MNVAAPLSTTCEVLGFPSRLGLRLLSLGFGLKLALNHFLLVCVTLSQFPIHRVSLKKLPDASLCTHPLFRFGTKKATLIHLLKEMTQ